MEKRKDFIQLKNKKHWKDDEIIEKIQTVSNWNNIIKCFKQILSNYDEKNETYYFLKLKTFKTFN